MTLRAHACEGCGSPANVHVMHDIGKPGSSHHLCMRCADRREDDPRPGHGALVGFLTLATGVILRFFTVRVGRLAARSA